MVRKKTNYEIVIGIKLPRNRSITTSLSKLLGIEKIYRGNGYIIVEVDDDILPQITKLLRKSLRDLELSDVTY